jgi:hypothetical protein
MPEDIVDVTAPAEAAAENPRATIGGNFPPLGRMIAAESGDFAAVVTAFLEDEYQQYPEQLNALLDGAANLPETITSQEDKEAVATVVKQLRDLNAKFEAFQKKEKQPYLRGGQAVDQFFFGMMDKLARRNRASQPGAMDTLIARMTAYDNMLIEQERQRREAEAAARRAEAERARQAAEAERRAAEEAQRAAARARTEATRAAREQEAEQARQRAAAATATAEVTAGNAEQARIETLTPAAATVRSRGQDGTLATTKTVKYAVIEDRTLLDKDKLWPFIPQDALERALAGWAKTTDYNVPMPGASIGRRQQSVVR